jgi:heat shock protein HslJ
MTDLVSLAGSEWGFPHDYPGDAARHAFVQFREHNIRGNAACNGFAGPYAQTGNSLKIGPLAVHKIYCTSPGVMEAEAANLQVLQRAHTIEATRLKLVIKNAAGAVIATLKRRDFD